MTSWSSFRNYSMLSPLPACSRVVILNHISGLLCRSRTNNDDTNIWQILRWLGSYHSRYGYVETTQRLRFPVCLNSADQRDKRSQSRGDVRYHWLFWIYLSATGPFVVSHMRPLTAASL
ncbi:hypothetical protein HD806DRAFT_33141 [Xylariaceae sp. AK1471]|nr:hypothetical protein HD806DRAFT_33141 [Xylariaceae sp. AK1471]